MILPGIDALEFFAAMRREYPQIKRAEAAMGGRLVIARNVPGLRVRAGITQTELARRVGTSQPCIAQIESAQANVTVDMLDRIAAAFGVKTATLFRQPRGSAQLYRFSQLIVHSSPADPVEHQLYLANCMYHTGAQ